MSKKNYKQQSKELGIKRGMGRKAFSVKTDFEKST